MRRLNKKGQGMSEYLIILALVAIATIGAVIFFADNVREQLTNLAQEISGQDSSVDMRDTSQGAAESTYDLTNFNATDLD